MGYVLRLKYFYEFSRGCGAPLLFVGLARIACHDQIVKIQIDVYQITLVLL